MDTRVHAYVRDYGVVCYKLPLFHLADSRCRGLSDELREAMCGCGLTWCWESIGWTGQQGEICAEGERRPRPLSILSADTIRDFIYDLETVDDEDWSIDIALFGIDNGSEHLIIDQYDLNLRRAVEHFATFEAGPIRIAMTLWTVPLVDGNCVFVPHRPVPAVQGLLDRWNVRPSSIKKHPYRRLAPLSLENCYALEPNRLQRFFSLGVLLGKLWS